MSDSSPPDVPDIAALVEVFNRHRVDYVIIGGAAAQFYLADWSPTTSMVSQAA